MDNFDNILKKERTRIISCFNKQSGWGYCFTYQSQLLLGILKRNAKHGKKRHFKNWTECLIILYRNLVVKRDGYERRNGEYDFDRCFTIWHNRLRSYYNSRFMKQDRVRSKELTKEEREWKQCLENGHSKLGRFRDNVGWKKLLYNSRIYIKKAEKMKLGSIKREKKFCKTWSGRLKNIKEGMARNNLRRNDHWVKLLDKNLGYLLIREKMRLGVEKYEQREI